MPFIGQLPGHWYDAAKDKYFKIEADSRATPSVEYTTSSVKRITDERRSAKHNKKIKRIRSEGTVKRALPLGDLAGGLLEREMGVRREAEVDLAAGTWAAGLEHKGGVLIKGPALWNQRGDDDIMGMVVLGDKETGLAIVYARRDKDATWASYFPPDTDDDTYKIPCGPRPLEIFSPSAPRAPTRLFYTTDGILQLDRGAQRSVSWLRAPAKTNSRVAKAIQGEIFALDLLRSNPANVLLAGGRCGQLCVADLRAPDGQWVSLDHTSSIAHIKALDEHHVLAAGPKNAMAVYDTRYTRRNPPGDARHGGGTLPVLTFPEYKNASSMQIGLDVLLGPEYGSGLVAAAHDDGKVALFSIRDGRKLGCPALDDVNLVRPSAAVPGPAYLQSNAVVKSVVFQTLPEDRHASLFVAARSRVEKFSFAFPKREGGW
ncbi:hypothetical protein QBC39DRAFT_375498 [Podospora conica]|nr:hypothetical protein QBC39DRAFT_375498 [Schizothecium conicum]